jgi:hypothetical protein
MERRGADSLRFNRLKAAFAQAIKDRGFNRADAIFPTETRNEIARFFPLPSQQARVARKLFDGILPGSGAAKLTLPS